MKVSKRNVIQALVALLVVYAINATDVLVVGAESENVILNFVSKFSYSVFTVNILDIMTWIGMYALIAFAFKDHEFKLDIAGLVVAVLLSFLYIWSFSYKADENTLFANSYQTFLTMFRFIGYTILFYVGFKILYDILRNANLSNNPKERKIFLISSLIIFAGWMFWLVMAYPGSVAGDGVTQLGQFYFKEVSAHHPPFSTWIMGTLFNIGKALTGDGRFGVFLYLLFQAICGALIIGYSIETMYEIGASRAVCYVSALVFSITPIFGMFAQWYEKDMMYSIFTLLFFVKLVLICLNTEAVTIKDCIILTVEGLLCIFLRNNGIYAVIPAMLALLFILKGKVLRAVTAGCVIFSVLLSLIVNGPIFDAMGIEPTNIKEALSIPMQQSARYIKEYGGEVTEEEREVLENFFDDYENIPNIYTHYCADDVKFHVCVEKEDLPRYFATWFKMGLKHPGVYFDAFMCLNFGYLAPTEQNAEATVDMPNQNHGVVLEQLGDMGVDGTQDEVRLEILKDLIFINMVFPIIRYLTMPGVYMWLMIAITAIFIKSRNRKAYIILIPNVINLLVCLASPLCNGMRYELPVVLSMPLMLAITAYVSRVNADGSL